ncbi:MAG: hypothetical protein ACREIH_00185 [Nitrospiraceae bacterium]
MKSEAGSGTVFVVAGLRKHALAGRVVALVGAQLHAAIRPVQAMEEQVGRGWS